jgi:hypothetical protein
MQMVKTNNDFFCFLSDCGTMELKKKKQKFNRALTVLREKGSVNLFYKNLREVSVSFKNRGGVNVILIDLKGGDCNLPL